MRIQFESLRKVCSIFALLAVVAASSRAATAQVIIQYDTEGVGSAAVTVTSVKAINPAAGVTGIDVTRGSGLTPTSAGFSINSSGWNDLSAGHYYQFGFKTAVPYTLNTFTVGLRSSATGPGFVDLTYSKDGGAFVPLSSVNPIELIGTNFTDLAANLSSVGQVNNSLIFRIVVDPARATNAGFNQTGTGSTAIGSAGTFRFGSYDPGNGTFLNPTITGSAVSSVPEPSALNAAGLAVLCCAGIWGRRRLRLARK